MLDSGSLSCWVWQDIDLVSRSKVGFVPKLWNSGDRNDLLSFTFECQFFTLLHEQLVLLDASRCNSDVKKGEVGLFSSLYLPYLVGYYLQCGTGSCEFPLLLCGSRNWVVRGSFLPLASWSPETGLFLASLVSWAMPSGGCLFLEGNRRKNLLCTKNLWPLRSFNLYSKVFASTCLWL